MPPQWNFWLGHQGYEYVDLGRLWQIGKFIGIVLWLVLMMRCIGPALKRPGDKNLLALFTASVIAIGLFYGAGLFYGERTHITVMEYWRWWVVHLWVEGFFEVFATAALAFIFCSMGLVSRPLATAATLASASLFMLGGIPGTFHHLYFSGTTTPVMAVGATFSALEVVPLVVLG
ncbi:MAG: cbb3-type cytochrome c oxidase subunit I, partial [Methylotenera sp.]